MEIGTGKMLARHVIPRVQRPYYFAASADGRTVVLGGFDGKVRVFQVKSD